MIIRGKALAIMVVAVTCLGAGPSLAAVWYVDAGAPSGGDGSGWGQAFRLLQDALNAAQAGDGIHVAEGVYRPDERSDWPAGGAGDRDATFQLVNGVQLLGGFAGFGAPDPNQRDPEAYETILSGDLAENDGPEPFQNNDENSLHVVTGSYTFETTILDGFTITAGNASSSWCCGKEIRGGGLLVYNGAPGVADCVFRENYASYGGGAYLGSFGGTMAGCTFLRNSAETGAGVCVSGLTGSLLQDCTFAENSAVYYGGGLGTYYPTNVTLSRCSFIDNVAGDAGGGIYLRESTAEMTACSFHLNTSGSGGGIHVEYYSSLTAVNCSFSENYALSGSCGGGIHTQWISDSTLINCSFTGNVGGNGAGLCCWTGTSNVLNCVFNDNSAWYWGGAVYNSTNTSFLTNCLLSGNQASTWAAAIFNQDARVFIADCTVAGNWEPNGWAIVARTDNTYYFHQLTVTNSVLWNGGNEVWHHPDWLVTVDRSDVQGGWLGTGNIDAEPLFVDPAGQDYRLLSGSPCIDAGDNIFVPIDDLDLDSDGDVAERVPVDVRGLPRFVDDPVTVDTGRADPPDYANVVDMGAYEYQQDCNGNGVIDSLDLAAGTSGDCNANHMPDECESGGDIDCDGNGVSDLCDIVGGTSNDVNTNGVPDECEDCNGNELPDDWEPAAWLMRNTTPLIGVLDTTAPVSQDLHLTGTAYLHELTVLYGTTGSSAGSMMVRLFRAGSDGSIFPAYPQGLIAEYGLGTLDWLPGGFGTKILTLDPALSLPTHLWVEVEIDKDAGVILRQGPLVSGFSQGHVYDRDAGHVLPGQLYLGIGMAGVLCSSDCNENGLEDACDIACGPPGGLCDVAGCGGSPDCDRNGVPDECDYPGDFNLDGNVDLSDFATFAKCFTGPFATIPPVDCSPAEFLEADLDGDGDVDLNDFSRFANCFTG